MSNTEGNFKLFVPTYFREEIEEPHDYELSKKEEPPASVKTSENGGDLLFLHLYFWLLKMPWAQCYKTFTAVSYEFS